MIKKESKKPVVLIIRDGWGIRRPKASNAPKLSITKYTDYILKNYPKAILKASEEAVGLPKRFQGNSEVGHFTIGAGRTIDQAYLRITKTIEDGSFFKNKAFVKIMNHIKKKSSTLHIMGLVQDQGVHAHYEHLFALLKMAKNKGISRVYIHSFTDGRDTPAKSAEKYLKKLDKFCKKEKIGKIVCLTGRYYAMDRNNKWDRVKIEYDALVHGKGEKVKSWQDGLKLAYKKGETDEFIKPKIIENYKGLNENDGIIFFNYRFDRTRELTKALIENDFDKFSTKKLNIKMVAMTEYYKNINCDVAFKPQKTEKLLGEIISKAKLKQLRISETEKYAHVTFFFNGLIEKPYKGEDRIIIESPKVATYDMKPEMSVYKISNRLIKELDKNKYDFAVINLVNGDMVGHTGKLDAAIKACYSVDECLKNIVEKVLELDGCAVISADHGNCEEMSGIHQTSHTLNPVHCIFVSNKKKKLKKESGTLADIAPSILKLLKIKKPKEMSGKSLL